MATYIHEAKEKWINIHSSGAGGTSHTKKGNHGTLHVLAVNDIYMVINNKEQINI